MINVKNVKRKFLDLLSEKKFNDVLDLGCNKGYMSKRFAMQGAKVIGIDKESQEIDIPNFSFKQMNMKNFSFENYDLVIASLVLHFFDNEEALKLLNKIKDSTLEGGYNFIICMSNLNPTIRKDNFYPSLDEIKKIYSNWKIKEILQDFTEYESHGSLGEHRHNLIFFLAEK